MSKGKINWTPLRISRAIPYFALIFAVLFLVLLVARAILGHTTMDGLDLDAIISLVVTLLLITIALYLMPKPKETSETESNLVEYISSVLGKSLHTRILNLILVGVSFLAIWSSVREAGLAFFQILSSFWLVSNYLSTLLNSLGLALAAFLTLTLVELFKSALDEPKTTGLETIQILVKTGIIASLIALLQLLPQITNTTLYEGWISITGNPPISDLLLPVIVVVVASSLISLIVTYFVIEGRKVKLK